MPSQKTTDSFDSKTLLYREKFPLFLHAEMRPMYAAKMAKI
jgi:hypothetical protein